MVSIAGPSNCHLFSASGLNRYGHQLGIRWLQWVPLKNWLLAGKVVMPFFRIRFVGIGALAYMWKPQALGRHNWQCAMPLTRHGRRMAHCWRYPEWMSGDK